MGILKAAKTNENKSHEAEAAKQTPAFESEDGAGQEATVKTVTRADVKKEETHAQEKHGVHGGEGATLQTEQAAAAQATESSNMSSKEAEQPGQPREGAAATEKPVETSKSTAVLARAPGGQLKTFLNNGGGMVSPLADLENAFGKAGIEIDYSTFPRLRVDAGCIATPEGAEAGEWIEIQIVSYSPSWTVTPGVDGKEGKEHVRFSDDGKVTNPAGDADQFAGTALDEYREHLVSLGFEKASIKEYLVVYGLALDCEEADFAHKNEMVALSLAPESRKKFDSYKINRAIQAKMGRVVEKSGNPVVKFTSVRVSGKERSYFNLVPSHGVTEPIDLA